MKITMEKIEQLLIDNMMSIKSASIDLAIEFGLNIEEAQELLILHQDFIKDTNSTSAAYLYRTKLDKMNKEI